MIVTFWDMLGLACLILAATPLILVVSVVWLMAYDPDELARRAHIRETKARIDREQKK